jgi:hypothetical protein
MKTKAKATLFALNLIEYKKAFFILFLLGGFVFAACTVPTSTSSASDKLGATICNIYCMLNAILPIIAFTLFVLAGVAYGVGQFFGADTRAKAAGWGMSALTGAIIMLIIYIMGPVIITALYPSSAGSCTG